MTTELVLLLCLSVFVSAGAFFGEKGPFKVFEKSAPRLGARLEQNIAIGRDFKVRTSSGDQNPTEWKAPSGNAPTGQF
jgi:hypothetical protein